MRSIYTAETDPNEDHAGHWEKVTCPSCVGLHVYREDESGIDVEQVCEECDGTGSIDIWRDQ